MYPTPNFNVGALPVADLEIGEESVFVCETEGEEAAGVHARVLVEPHQHHGRTATLKDAPSRPPKREVVEELDIDGGQRKVAAEPAVDSRPESEISEQLSGLEVRSHEALLRVHADAALEPDALRLGAAVYQKKDSEKAAIRRDNVS